jgi:hypothetical protein
MFRLFKASAFISLMVFAGLIFAQESLPMCPPPSQKVESWNKCIGGYTYPNGIKYFGSWKNDYASGEGIIIYPNKNMYVGTFSNDKAIGRGAIFDKNGKMIKAGYGNSPEIGTQYFLNVGDGYISESDGYFGYDQTGQYVSGIQARLGRYIDLLADTPTQSKSGATNNPSGVKNSQRPPGGLGIDSKVEQQRQKCARLGLTSGSDDFKLCMQQ